MQEIVDTEFTLYTSKGKIDIMKLVFSDGAIRYRLPEYTGLDRVSLIVSEKIDINTVPMKLALLQSLLENLGVNTCKLIFKYLPYARADRLFGKGESFGLDAFAKLIDPFYEVFAYDIHNFENAENLIGPITDIRVNSFIGSACSHLGSFNTASILIAPDKGAKEKVKSVAEYFELEAVYAEKIRDTKTGQITDTTLSETDKVKGRDCVIVDDICDGGGTFIPLAKKLKHAGAKTVTLYVTHGIFSKGIDPLKEHIDYIAPFQIIGNYVTIQDVENFNERNK